MSRYARVQFVLALLALCWSAGIAAQAAGSVTTTISVVGNVAEILSLTVADLKRYPRTKFNTCQDVARAKRRAASLRADIPSVIDAQVPFLREG